MPESEIRKVSVDVLGVSLSFLCISYIPLQGFQEKQLLFLYHETSSFESSFYSGSPLEGGLELDDL